MKDIMDNYKNCSIIVDKNLFSTDNRLLEGINHKNLTKDTIKINIETLEQYLSFSDLLEDKQYTIVNNGITYLVDGMFAVKVVDNAQF